MVYVREGRVGGRAVGGGGKTWGVVSGGGAGGRVDPISVVGVGGRGGSGGGGGQPEVVRGEPGPFEEIPHDLCAETRKGFRRETGGFGCKMKMGMQEEAHL